MKYQDNLEMVQWLYKYANLEKKDPLKSKTTSQENKELESHQRPSIGMSIQNNANESNADDLSDVNQPVIEE